MRDQAKPDDGARKTSATDARSSTRADDAGKDRKAADAGETSDKTKAEAGTDKTEVKDASASETKTSGTAAGDKPAGGKTVEERKAALAAALDGAPVIGKGTPDEQAAAGAVMQPVPPPAIAAEFLALAAIALQGGEPAKPEGATTEDGKAVTAAGASTEPATGEVIAVPVPPALPVKADGQASAGGEAAAADIKAGLKPQLPAAGAEARADGKSGEAKSGDTEQGAAKTAETKTGEAQATAKDDGEAGKVAATAAGSDTKAASETKAADAATAAPVSGQTTQAASTEATSGAQQASAPLSPQAILAAGPQSLTTPQAPLTELDAAAQATARAQAEAAHKMVSSETGRPTPLHVVPIEIGAQALAGNRRFDIRLDPAELGRIDVSLEISDKGDVSAKLTVDRVETLHMLQRDARTLERAFEQAGLKPSEGGIDLSLRDPGGEHAGGRQQQDDEAPRGRRTWVQASEDSALVTDVATLPRNASRLGGVDLSI
ncbi:flagellar hook-length control protein FliK [Bosea sp. (in: a-proteobacteria)]|uniref:flagellar hook-length control protein FliK n=1 Tax=Bosea sp. (in: a-proteobacteria) TaxID=1871050 RepID=UPI002DDD67AF|nr:flagellar hook-length control protein FliK [Bosea sp. (in: a-proteobacteria)]HEV2512190.1 flagellar hook-length control protein FliK [Bosea sp. (in: a-proteobacteria)]